MNIEPKTSAKVVIDTSKGELEIELWAKEVPIASRNFLQRCAEGYYEGTTFHRVLKDFLIQAGSGPLDDAPPFKDEFHSRLKFKGRGYLGCANVSGKRNSNGSQFFITVGNGQQVSNLNGKNTLFGKVVGKSIYNLARIESEGEILEDGETPMFPTVIKGVKILNPYFDDLKYKEYAEKTAALPVQQNKKPTKRSKVKVSYDEEDEDSDSQTIANTIKPRKRFKMKSAHELMSDKSLKIENTKIATSAIDKTSQDIKLKDVPKSSDISKPRYEKSHIDQTLDKTLKVSTQTSTADLHSQFKALRNSFKSQEPELSSLEDENDNEVSSVVEQERSRYKSIGKKGSEQRENRTLELLSKFRSKLKSESISANANISDGEDIDDDAGIYSHQFKPEHEASKDDSLITQYTGTRHNDEKFSQDDPENQLSHTSLLPKKSSHSRTSTLSTIQKMREEARKAKMEKLGN